MSESWLPCKKCLEMCCRCMDEALDLLNITADQLKIAKALTPNDCSLIRGLLKGLQMRIGPRFDDVINTIGRMIPIFDDYQPFAGPKPDCDKSPDGKHHSDGHDVAPAVGFDHQCAYCKRHYDDNPSYNGPLNGGIDDDRR